MLTVDQRAEAQERWKQSLGQIEAITGLSLFVLLSGVGGKISRRVSKIIIEARNSPDPSSVLASRIPQVRAIIQQEMALIEDSAALTFADARRRGVSAGAAEGLSRVSATGQPTRQVELDDVFEEQQEAAAAVAREFVSGAARRAQQSSFSQLFRAFGITADALDVAFTLNRWANQAAAYGARNSAVAGGRAGMWDAYSQNGQEGWVWVAGPLACDFCLGMSGLVFPITSKQESHPNCQCSMEPVRNIGDPAAGFNPTDAFAALPLEARQRVLGKRRAKQFDAGELNLREIPAERSGPVAPTPVQISRDLKRVDAVDAPRHLDGYEDLPGRVGKDFPPPAQDVLHDLTYRDTPRWREWRSHFDNEQYGDPAIRELGIAMGADARPTVYSASSIDEFVEAGEVEIWRGVDSPKYVTDFAEGPYNPGSGIFGNGYYATTNRATASEYTSASGAVQRMTLKSDARVADFDEIIKEMGGPRAQGMGNGAQFAFTRSQVGVETLPFDPPRALRELFDSLDDTGDSLRAEIRQASEDSLAANFELQDLWEDFVGEDTWKRIYKPDVALKDQITIVAIADPKYSIPGLRIPSNLRAAARRYLDAEGQAARLIKAEERVRGQAGELRKIASAASREDVVGLLSGLDAIRVTRQVDDYYYVILNRGAVRISDTVDVLEDADGILRFRQKKLLRSQEEALDDEIADVVDGRVAQAEALSKTLDKEMQEIAREMGAELDGLAFSVKGRGSMARKVKSKYNNAIAEGDPKTVREILDEEIRDANRYTVILDTASYGDNLEEFVAAFRSRGYSFSADNWRNTWSPTKKIKRNGVEIEVPNDYRGLNVNMRSPNGDLIEVQFHTKESFSTKQVNHDLYEEAREEGVSAARKGELEAIQARNAAEIPDPQRWDEFFEPPSAAAGGYATGVQDPRKLISSFIGQRGNKKIAADAIDEVMDELKKLGIRLPRGLNQWNDQSPRFGFVEPGQLPIEYKSKISGAVAFYESSQTRGGTFADQASYGPYSKGSRMVIGSEVIAKMTTKEAKRSSIGGTFVHEFGHFMDRELFGDASQTYATIRAKQGLDSPLSKWYDVVTKSKSYSRIEDGIEKMQSTVDGSRLRSPRSTQRYFLEPQELWARSLAQWFALRTDGRIYSVTDLRTDPANDFMRKVGLEPHWDDDDFEPIAKAIDEIMREMGWLV